jgi:nucleoporin SEH1
MVVATMDRVRVYRTRDTVRTALGVAAAWKGFYLAAEVAAGVHRGLVRDVAWAPGNVRGYDLLATACQDGWVRVFRLDAVQPAAEEGEEGDEEEGGAAGTGATWGAARVKKHGHKPRVDQEETPTTTATATAVGGARASLLASSGIRAGLGQSPARGASVERRQKALAGPVRHVVGEISRLDSHRTPVWRVAFDDDGQILGSVGDEGKLMCYRQKPDGTWAKSAEMAMVKMKMAVP